MQILLQENFLMTSSKPSLIRHVHMFGYAFFNNNRNCTEFSNFQFDGENIFGLLIQIN